MSITSSIDYFEFFSPYVEGLKRISNTEYQGHCPFGQNHSDGVDTHPSFSVNVETGMYYCHACGAKGNYKTFCREMGILSFDDQQRPEAIFLYCDEDGKLLYEVCRFPGKRFLQRKPDGQGGYIWKTKDVKRVLYRLPDLLKADPDKWIFIPEGEKHVDRLCSLGLTATCNAGGVGKWLSEYNQCLKDRRVCILPDNDQPGQAHAKSVAESIHGIAQEIKILDLPGLKEKGDVLDWLDGNPQKSDGIRYTKEELLKLVEEAPVWKPTAVKAVIKCGDSLMKQEMPEIKWLIPGFLPQGLMILARKPKIGKSWLVLDIALAISTGGIALGKYKCEPKGVLYLALEDNERRLRDRIKKLLPEDNKSLGEFYYATDGVGRGIEAITCIDQFLTANKYIKLVIIDTLQRVRTIEAGHNVYQSDSEALIGLQELAEKRDIAIIVVHHLRKTGSDDWMDQVSGSTGLTGVADTVAILERGRGEQDAMLNITGRDVEEIKLALQFDAGLWQVIGSAEEYQLSKERQEIIELLKLTPNLKPAMISQSLNRSRGAIRKLLYEMVRSGQVWVNSQGEYSLPQKVEGWI